MTEQIASGRKKVLADQVALVTGGGRGIGKAIAEQLAAAGAKVAVTARSQDEVSSTVRAIEQRGGRATALTADVTERSAVESVVSEVERSLGPIALLVNNAGIFGPIDVCWDADPDEWWRCLEVNVRGPFLCTRAVLPMMIERRHGRIVNLSSGAGLTPIPDVSAYCCSKAALVRLTDCVAKEVEGFGICVFAVNPGQVATGMHELLAASPAWLKRRGSHSPTFMPAERPAELVVRLAAGEADTLTGRLINVNDHLDDLIRRAETIQRDDLYTLRLKR
jgi:NAD(P)-dependent dehydrogenase (short-subunit alcohol dehydrogenase family)